MNMSSFSHTPVLLTEAIDGLAIKIGKKYIDATLGGGGHTSLILERGGVVLGIDRDKDALDYVSENQKEAIQNHKLSVVKGNFSDIKKIAIEAGFGNVEGVLFDLGVSSYQLDTVERGFSIKNDARLDMRMDRRAKLTAFDVVNHYPKDELIDIFYTFGEEHNAKLIATEIVDKRKKNEITTTKELASLIERIPHKSEPIHPATRVFQAIRIEVNGEITAIKKGVGESVGLLNSAGRVVVISFHSLEDRAVKQIFEKLRQENIGKIITKKPITADATEIAKNRRSRSAKLRIFEKK